MRSSVYKVVSKTLKIKYRIHKAWNPRVWYWTEMSYFIRRLTAADENVSDNLPWLTVGEGVKIHFWTNFTISLYYVWLDYEFDLETTPASTINHGGIKIPSDGHLYVLLNVFILDYCIIKTWAEPRETKIFMPFF